MNSWCEVNMEMVILDHNYVSFSLDVENSLGRFVLKEHNYALPYMDYLVDGEMKIGHQVLSELDVNPEDITCPGIDFNTNEINFEDDFIKVRCNIR